MSNLAIYHRPKVLFGSPDFMFLRCDINIMIRERDKLRWGIGQYEKNKDRVDFLQNLIRAEALRVYFGRSRRYHAQQAPIVPEAEARPWKKKKKVKFLRKMVDEKQSKLFDQ